mmetsp:Transcript_11569/g.42318  ORF Transcript_11569/g.42318 Transcript_11569/m.42318 type:complete len:106 (-) Transcript_11569:1124-1441(-)
MQAPGSDECERAFMYTKMGYDSGDQHGLTIFDKVLVNGPQQSPVYTFLKSEGKLPGCAGCEVAWNYEKFLVDFDGAVIKRYPATFDPADALTEIAEVVRRHSLAR